MIEKIGIKTTIPELIAYKVLKPGENELVELAKLSKNLHEKMVNVKDPQMIIYYGEKDDPNCHREVAIPIETEVEGIKTKLLPEIKAAFLVFIGTDKPISYYYETLSKYIKNQGLELTQDICSIEALFQPDEFNTVYGDFVDEDNPEYWRNELILQVKE
jgi:effector-binding domain-containing protein